MAVNRVIGRRHAGRSDRGMARTRIQPARRQPPSPRAPGHRGPRWPISQCRAPDLLGLPGIGPYTASALLSFANDLPVAVADTNIARSARAVLRGTRVRSGRPTRGEVGVFAERFLPETGSRDHNLALMDLGAVVCISRNPACGECPFSSHCIWLSSGSPRSTARPETRVRFEDTARFARGRIVDALRTAESLCPREIASLSCPPGMRCSTERVSRRRSSRTEWSSGRQTVRWSLPGRRVRAG